MAEDRILDKIRKCLAMANDSRGNAAECENAMRQAQALMAKHGLSTLDLDAAEVTTITLRSRVSVRKPAQWEVNMCHAICAMFGLHVPLWSQGGPEPTKKGWWHFIGSKVYTEVAEYTYEVLYRQILSARNEYVKSLCDYSRAEKSSLANDFCQGWVQQVQKNTSKMHDPDGLMLKRIEAYMQKNSLNPKELAAHDYEKKAQAEAYYQGMREAEGVRLNHAAGNSTNGVLRLE